MRRVLVATFLLLAGSACSGPEEASTEATPTRSPSVSAEETPEETPEVTIRSPIVGDWVREMTCEERVSALEEVGLGRFAAEHVAGNELVPGISYDEPELIDPQRPCKGAVPRKHGRFFTKDGGFGSTDHRGEQVDDGSFTLTGDRTIVVDKEFGSVTFNFRLRDGELFLEPVMPKCLDKGCWAAQWAVAVASPGHPWRRQ